MPASPIRRRHRLSAPFLGAVLALGLLAGCAGQRTPDSYTADVKKNFIAGCTKTATDDGATFDVESFCTCAFNAIKADVPFGDFKAANDDQIEEPQQLPDAFTEAYAKCDKES